mgnify:CR=1 FL=1
MATTFADAWSVATAVDGWLLEAQGRELFEAANSVPSGCVAVEIGSHRGKSAVIIAMGLAEGISLTCVDPFDDPRWGGGPESLALFQSNIERAGVASRIELFKGLSGEASAQWQGEPVGFLWVDGAHDLKSTLTDFDGWMPHMAKGGLLYVHDAFSAVGTTQAIFTRFFFNSQVVFLGAERTLAKFRVGPATPLERVASKLRLLGRVPFFARMIAIKLARRRGLKTLERRFMRVPDEPLI